VRAMPLMERKRALRSIMPTSSKHLLCVDHVDGHGERLFELTCARDLEGIVAKHRRSRYSSEEGNPAWSKSRTETTRRWSVATSYLPRPTTQLPVGNHAPVSAKLSLSEPKRLLELRIFRLGLLQDVRAIPERLDSMATASPARRSPGC
jgi:hypothetical protein